MTARRQTRALGEAARRVQSGGYVAIMHQSSGTRTRGVGQLALSAGSAVLEIIGSAPEVEDPAGFIGTMGEAGAAVLSPGKGLSSDLPHLGQLQFLVLEAPADIADLARPSPEITSDAAVVIAPMQPVHDFAAVATDRQSAAVQQTTSSANQLLGEMERTVVVGAVLGRDLTMRRVQCSLPG